GAFLGNNGSISYYNTDSSQLTNSLFETANSRTLGDVVQSIAIGGDKAFIVVSNSKKVEVVDLKTFESAGVITGVNYPRYFHVTSSSKGYIANGSYAGKLYAVDIASVTITDSINVGNGPEKMVSTSTHLYVANTGGWTTDSTVTVVDLNTDQVTTTIYVGDAPKDLVLDADNNAWVLCSGKTVYDTSWTIIAETKTKLVKINTSTDTVETTIEIGVEGDHASQLSISADGQTLYYINNGIYALPITATTEATSVLISETNYIGLDIDPETDNIYVTKIPSYTVNGWIFRYKSDGSMIDSLEVGIAPNNCTFN
ncbi:MAG: hypothetical protein JKY33_03400, partial [Bacteroidia bacterium]|nr:hypothetical protein [Bacteroidia bacterium]